MSTAPCEGGACAQAPARAPLRRALLLGLVAVLLNAPFVGWGAPHATAADRTLTFATDDVLPLGALAEMHNTFVESKPDRNYAYPWWHYFVVACAQAPYLAWLGATGGLESPTPEYPFGFVDPVGALRALTLIGRTVTVLMAGGVVACAYLFARTLWSERAGVLAAFLTALDPWFAYYSRTGNLDVPALFWSALGLVVYARILRSGLTARRAAWLGIFAGVAMATKDQALALFLPLAIVLCLPRFARDASGRYAFRPALAGLAASLAAYAVCTGMLVDPMRHVTHVRRLFFDQGTLTAAHSYWPHAELSFSSAIELALGTGSALAALATPIVLVLGVVGLAASLDRRNGSPRDATVLLPIPATYVLLVLATGIVIRRYMLPLLFPIDAFAAAGLALLLAPKELRPDAARFARALGIALAVLAFGWRGAQTLDLSHAQVAETRTAAAQWIRERAQPGDRLEFFGHAQVLPHLPAEVESRRVLGRTRWEGELDHGPAVLAHLASGAGPELLAVIPDWTSKPGMQRSEDCPQEVFDALETGTAGYELVAYFPPPRLLPGPLARPVLDSPCVAPSVRLYARDDVARRFAEDAP